jgi:O-antigen ligase
LEAFESLAIRGAAVSGRLADRCAPTLSVLLVATYALSWSWVDVVARLASAAFWGLLLVFVALVAPSLPRAAAKAWLGGVAVLAGVLAATALWSVDPSSSIREVVKFIAVVLVAACVGGLVQSSRAAARRLANALALLAPGALACAALAVVGASVASSDRAGTSGFFNGPNLLGMFLALTLPFLLMHPFVRERLGLTLAAVAAVSLVSALSASRTGLLAVVVAIVVLGIGARARRWLLLCVAVCAVSIAAAHVSSPQVPTLGDPIIRGAPDQVDQLFGEQRPSDQSLISALVGARDEGWLEAMRLLSERPFAGHGFGTGSMLFDRYESRERFTYFVGAFAEGVNPHNSYLQLLLELGIVVGILFLLPLLLAAVLAGKLVASGRADAPLLAFGSTLIACLVTALFESTLTQFGSLTLLTWISAAAIGGFWLRDRGDSTRD